MNRSLVFDLATCAFIGKREDALFLGPGGTGKSHLAQAIGQTAVQQGYRVLYRETHVLLDDLAEAVVDGTRKEFILMNCSSTVRRRPPHPAAIAPVRISAADMKERISWEPRRAST
jgi:DNA replication protein DnaC